MDMISHSVSLTYIFNMVNDYKHHKKKKNSNLVWLKMVKFLKNISVACIVTKTS